MPSFVDDFKFRPGSESTSEMLNPFKFERGVKTYIDRTGKQLLEPGAAEAAINAYLNQIKKDQASGIAEAGKIKKEQSALAKDVYGTVIRETPDDLMRRGMGDAAVVASMVGGAEREKQEALADIKFTYNQAVRAIKSGGATAMAQGYMQLSGLAFQRANASLQATAGTYEAFSKGLIQGGATLMGAGGGGGKI